jgi:predicted glycosyltransferase
MQIMLYCQHVLGVGHFFRSMELARAFQPHGVLFVEGGTPLPEFIPPSNVQTFFLPPIMMNADFSQFETRDRQMEELKSQRKHLLEKAFRELDPDILIIELFPFGRKFFGFELLPLLRAIRQDSLPVKIICSLRDILVEKRNQAAYEQRVIDILNAYFDLLLIHSDPGFIRLDQTFSCVGDIRIPAEYTGFVTRKVSLPGPGKSDGLIVVSGGGSNVGFQLLEAAIRAFPLVPGKELRLLAFMGPFIEPYQRRQLSRLAEQDKRITLAPFSSDYLNELAAAALSISMAGYNTCMDILSTGVRALVYPFPQNREQRMRAERLEQAGVLKILQSIEVEYFAQAIAAEIERDNHAGASSLIPIMQDGAARTVQIVEKYFAKL